MPISLTERVHTLKKNMMGSLNSWTPPPLFCPGDLLFTEQEVYGVTRNLSLICHAGASLLPELAGETLLDF